MKLASNWWEPKMFQNLKRRPAMLDRQKRVTCGSRYCISYGDLTIEYEGEESNLVERSFGNTSLKLAMIGNSRR